MKDPKHLNSGSFKEFLFHPENRDICTKFRLWRSLQLRKEGKSVFRALSGDSNDQTFRLGPCTAPLTHTRKLNTQKSLILSGHRFSWSVRGQPPHPGPQGALEAKVRLTSEFFSDLLFFTGMESKGRTWKRIEYVKNIIILNTVIWSHFSLPRKKKKIVVKPLKAIFTLPGRGHTAQLLTRCQKCARQFN